MGLDLYAGTLTRYYAQNWKTSVQQWAEENGYRFEVLTPDGQAVDDEPLDPEMVRQDATAWRDSLLAAVVPKGQPHTPWVEDNETPYYTDKPDWDAYGAMLLYGAGRILGEPLPPTVQKGWNYGEHPLIRRATEEITGCSLYGGAEWWIPLDDRMLFQCQTMAGNEILIATTGALRADLERINRLGWQADPETILSWSEVEGYPADAVIRGGTLSPEGRQEEYRTESLAKFAFSIFYRAVQFSSEYYVPILLDY